MQNQLPRARTQQILGDKSRRQELNKAFIEEALKLYWTGYGAEIQTVIPGSSPSTGALGSARTAKVLRS